MTAVPRLLRVRNLAKFQHYKNRHPPWVKLHRSVMSDYQFTRLQDASKAHLMLIWVLASGMDNAIPDDAAWISARIGATEPVNIEALVSAGFLDRYAGKQRASKTLPPRKQKCGTETEGETEGEYILGADAPDAVKTFDACWATYPKRTGANPRRLAERAYRATVARGGTPDAMYAGVLRYRAFCDATGKSGTEYVQRAATFFGPDEHWREPWDVGAPALSREQEGWLDQAQREQRKDAEVAG